jgi:NADPH-dependent ferric siderophore reductase
MPFQPGHKLSVGGRKDRPFNEALRLEIAAAGPNKRALRAIARNLLSLAQVPDMAALPAIREIADRLDGKPKQEAEVTLRQAIARELSDDDLAAIAIGGEDEEIQQDPKPGKSELN